MTAPVATLARIVEALADQRQVMRVLTSSPRQRAYQVGWLADETAWLDLLRARDQTSHADDESLARAICDDVRRCFPEMERSFRELRQRAGRSARTS